MRYFTEEMLKCSISLQIFKHAACLVFTTTMIANGGSIVDS